MAEIFVTKVVPYNLRSSNNFVLPRARSSLYRIDIIRSIGLKLWQTFPREIKEFQSLEILKRNISSIKTFDSSCKLCKSFYYYKHICRKAQTFRSTIYQRGNTAREISRLIILNKTMLKR